MPTPRMKFNPGFRSDEEIIEDFLVRHADLDLVLRTIRESTGAPRNQHLLIVGPRGMGKTTLVLRAAAEIRSDPGLQAAWYPIVFSEESYSVSTPGEFWLEALDHLAHQTEDAEQKRAHEELSAERDEIRLRGRALARLLDFADRQGRRLLLIVENLQMLLQDQLSSDDAWVLRETLQNESRLMLLATATSRFQEIENVDEAMYEQCLVHELRPLDDDECREFWERRTGTTLAGRQIRPIRILTGGNPRLLAIISSFAANSSFEELMTDLVQLVDDHTDYFKGHLDQLAPMERKVFVTLADIWDPTPARDVAAAARLEVSETSAQLHRLSIKGAVLAEGAKRTRKYQVAERMYNIYYLMRRRGDAAARVKALVRFMLEFYAPGELLTVTRAIAGEALQQGSSASDHATFLTELRRLVGSAPRGNGLDEIVTSVANMQVSEPAPSGVGAALSRGERIARDPDLLPKLTDEYWRAIVEADDPHLSVQFARVHSPAEARTPSLPGHSLKGMIRSAFLIRLSIRAAAGYTSEVLAAIQASPSAPLLEPLIAALRLDAGEEVSVAQEIMEVARDILSDIEEERKKLAPASEPDEKQ